MHDKPVACWRGRPDGASRRDGPALRVGIVGHRDLGDAAGADFVARASAVLLDELQAGLRADGRGLVVLSPLAEGADSVFAAAALQRRLPVETVRPYRHFGHDFGARAARRRYRRLRAAARRETDLGFDVASDEAFEAAMDWVVAGCHLLVAAWDPRRPGLRGGTAHAVTRARDLGRPWVHLDLAHRRVVWHPGPRSAWAEPGRGAHIDRTDRIEHGLPA